MEKNRVLSRVGARILSDEEIQEIAGGFIVHGMFGSGLGTGACNDDPVTCRVISGDCSDVRALPRPVVPHPRSTNLKRPGRPFLIDCWVATLGKVNERTSAAGAEPEFFCALRCFSSQQAKPQAC